MHWMKAAIIKMSVVPWNPKWSYKVPPTIGAKIKPKLVVEIEIADALSQRERDSSIYKAS